MILYTKIDPLKKYENNFKRALTLRILNSVSSYIYGKLSASFHFSFSFQPFFWPLRMLYSRSAREPTSGMLIRLRLQQVLIRVQRTTHPPFTRCHMLEIEAVVAQCGNLIIFLLLRFYVKLLLMNERCKNQFVGNH